MKRLNRHTLIEVGIGVVGALFLSTVMPAAHVPLFLTGTFIITVVVLLLLMFKTTYKPLTSKEKSAYVMERYKKTQRLRGKSTQ